MTVEQRLRDAFREGTADIEPRPDAWDDIQAAIPRPARRIPVRPLLLAAAAASIAVVGVFALNADDVREVQTIAPATDPTSGTPTTTEPTPSETSAPAPTEPTEPTTPEPTPGGVTPPPPTPTAPPDTEPSQPAAPAGPRRASTYVGARGSIGDGELATEATAVAPATSFEIRKMGSFTPGPYDVIHTTADEGTILWLYRHDDANRPNMVGTIVDGVDLALAPDETVSMLDVCEANWQMVTDIVGIVPSGSRRNHPVRQAWRVDLSAGRLIEIDSTDVRCLSG